MNNLPLRDSFRILSELLSFALSSFHSIAPSVALSCHQFCSNLIVQSAQFDVRSGLQVRTTNGGISATIVEEGVEPGSETLRTKEFQLFLDNDLFLSGLESGNLETVQPDLTCNILTSTALL